MTNTDAESNNGFKLDLANAAQLASFAIILGAIFALLRNYIYYVLFLHVPIFQYLDLSDIVLIAPTAIFWTAYFGSVEAANSMKQNPAFSFWEHIFYRFLLYAFAAYLTWLGFRNEPGVEQGLKFILSYGWYLLPLLVVYIIVRMRAIESKKDFFKKNKYAAACMLTIWYATFDSWANYSVLTNPSRHVHFILKMKSGKKLIADNNLIYVGRTKGYWFLYNSKTKFVRTLKNDDVEIADFDIITR